MPSPAAVWILSCSEEAAGIFSRHLPEQWDIQVTVFDHPSRGANLADVGALRAATAILNRPALDSPAFLGALGQCVREVGQREDFRLFVWLDGLLQEDLKEAAAEDSAGRRKPIADLLDTVHMSDSADPAAVASTLVGYIKVFRDVRFAETARSIQFWVEGLLALSGAALLVISVTVVTALGAATLLPSDYFQRWLTEFLGPPTLTALTCAAILPALFLGLVLLRRPISGTRQNVLLAATVAFLIVAGYVNRGNSGEWLAFGLAVGVLADYARRLLGTVRWRLAMEGPRRSRSMHALLRLTWFFRDPANFLPQQTDRNGSETTGRPAKQVRIPSPLFDPWGGRIAKRVFISYTRSGEWSVPFASELAKNIFDSSLEVFLDSQSIRIGSGWLGELRRRLPEADIVIVLVEPKTLNKEWPAWELNAAMLGRQLLGQPEVIILVHPDVPKELPANAHPVFRETLGAQHRFLASIPRVISVQRDTSRIVTQSLWTGGMYAAGLMPAKLSVLVEGIAALFPSAALGGIVGQASFIMLVLGWQNVLKSPEILPWAIMLSGYLLGFRSRLALSHLNAAPDLALKAQKPTTIPSAFRDLLKIARANERIPKAAALLGFLDIAGLTANLIVLAPMAPPLMVSWTVLLTVLGWYLGGDMVSRVSGFWRGLAGACEEESDNRRF